MESRPEEAWSVNKIDPAQVMMTKELLGAGAHGVVLKGYFRGNAVALKRVRKGAEYAGEAPLLKHCQHASVLKVIGTYRDDARRQVIVTELCERRSIADVFESDDCSIVLPAHALRFMRQIAEAMRHLHLLGVAHRDLKPANVMVCADLSIRLGDFGQARKEAPMMSNAPGSAYYMAPEAYQGHDYSTGADVYSYAITCWEILEPSHQSAWPRNMQETQVQQAMQRGVRPSLEKIPDEARPLIQQCWDGHACSRPQFKDLLTPGGLLDRIRTQCR